YRAAARPAPPARAPVRPIGSVRIMIETAPAPEAPATPAAPAAQPSPAAPATPATPTPDAN
ncbi:MAG: hypothetical protein R3A52_33235, partial [Polyangiales bacterium]